MLQPDDSEGSGRVNNNTHPKKRRARLISPSVEENLKSVNNSRKRAQELYYGKTGQSPLVRSIANLQQTSKSVHERLGKTKIVLRRTRNIINNTAAPRIQKRLRRTNVRNINNNNNSNIRTLVRRSANQRLARIRYQQGIDNLRQALQTQTVRLRRRTVPQQPTNFRVEVTNPSYRNQAQALGSFTQHSVQSSVDPIVQAQIRLIQGQSNFNREINIIAPQPIFVPGGGVTCMFLNERFATLP